MKNIFDERQTVENIRGGNIFTGGESIGQGSGIHETLKANREEAKKLSKEILSQGKKQAESLEKNAGALDNVYKYQKRANTINTIGNIATSASGIANLFK